MRFSHPQKKNFSTRFFFLLGSPTPCQLPNVTFFVLDHFVIIIITLGWMDEMERKKFPISLTSRLLFQSKKFLLEGIIGGIFKRFVSIGTGLWRVAVSINRCYNVVTRTVTFGRIIIIMEKEAVNLPFEMWQNFPHRIRHFTVT